MPIATSQVKWSNLQVSPCPRLRVVADVGFGSWVNIMDIYTYTAIHEGFGRSKTLSALQHDSRSGRWGGRTGVIRRPSLWTCCSTQRGGARARSFSGPPPRDGGVGRRGVRHGRVPQMYQPIPTHRPPPFHRAHRPPTTSSPVRVSCQSRCFRACRPRASLPGTRSRCSASGALARPPC